MYKFKQIIAIFLILNAVFIMGCGVKSDEKAEIQLWWYDRGVEKGLITEEIQAINNTKSIIQKIQLYCDSNNIPFKTNIYKSSEISYENYVLKRNLNLSKDNIIIMDTGFNLYEMDGKHCDYSKIANYKNLYEGLKKLPFIPIDMSANIFTINLDLLQKYNGKLDKNVISYTEYLDVVNKMKDSGLDLEGSNLLYLNEICNLKKENLFSNETKIKDENLNAEKYRRVINQYVKDMKNKGASSGGTRDISTQLELSKYNMVFRQPEQIVDTGDVSKKIKCVDIYRNTIGGQEYCEDFNFKKYKVVVQPTSMDYCFFIGKNVTNVKVYDIGNLLMEQGTVFNLNSNFNIYESDNKFPTMKYNDIYKYLGFGQNGTCLFDNASKDYNDKMVYDEEFKQQLDTMYKEIYSGIFNDIKKEYYDSIQIGMPINQYIISSICNISKKVIDNPETDLDSEINNMVNELKLKYK